jgi:hypothetical protein
MPENAPAGPSFSMMANMVGALVSLALVVGVGVWGYKLLMRDVSGVPVVRALQGEMRIASKDPGGQAADHQGLAVNTVVAQGAAAPTADRVKLAPRPIDLTEEDAPAAELTPAKARSGPSDAALAAYQGGEVDALVEELTRDVAPLSDETPAGMDGAPGEAANSRGPETLTEDEAPEVSEEQAIDPADIRLLTLPGVKRSPRPLERPDDLARLASTDEADVAAALSSAADAVASIDVDPDSLPSGTRLAQLGAFDSPEIAREEWDRIAARFEDYLDGKNRVIQQAQSGGRSFYRLRAMGFDDISDARRFCSALVAGGADCIPVTTR